MRPQKNYVARIQLDSHLLHRQARSARSKYIGDLLAGACSATVSGIRAGRVNAVVCAILIVSGIAVMAI